jgi:hypothetical protein
MFPCFQLSTQLKSPSNASVLISARCTAIFMVTECPGRNTFGRSIAINPYHLKSINSLVPATDTYWAQSAFPAQKPKKPADVTIPTKSEGGRP